MAVAGAGSALPPAASSVPMAESSESDEEVDIKQFKVIVLGDGAVGKTSMLHRFASDTFGKTYKQTIGVDFFMKRIELPGGVIALLQCWDIGGQTIGSKMLQNYIFGAHAVVLAYDITNSASFADLEDWLSECKTVFKEGMPALYLVGNKSDLGHLRTVKPQRHKDFADMHRMQSYFVSAKTGDNVAAVFYQVAANLSGVAVTKPDMQAAAKVLPATIINHQQNDPGVEAPSVGSRKSDRKCAIM